MHVPFFHEEKEHYRRIEQPLVDMLDRTTRSGSHANVPWMIAIQQINKLRLICDLGVFVSPPSTLLHPISSDDSTSLMNTRFLVGGKSCTQCLQPVDASMSGYKLLNTTQTQVYYSACNNFYCTDCAALLRYRFPDRCVCNQPCQLSLLATFLPTPRLSPTDKLSPSYIEGDQSNDISSKI